MMSTKKEQTVLPEEEYLEVIILIPVYYLNIQIRIKFITLH